MRNLVNFIWKHNFIFLFLLLEILSFSFLFQNNAYHKAGFINSASGLAGSIYNANADLNEYLSLKQTNKILAEENAAFRSRSEDSYMKVSDRITRINDTTYKQQFSYLSAKVVNNSTQRRNNYLTLDMGSLNGIKPDMAVISTQGIVGIVKDVSPNFCSVMSLLHKDAKVSCKLKEDGSFGPLSWEGSDYRYATLGDIPTHVRLKAGDKVVTSSFSSIFPEGIMVGFVESYERKSGDYFYTVKVRLSTDFKKLDYVYIVNNILKEEKEILEKSSQHD